MNKKTIHWLVPYDNPSLDAILNSNLASIRLRLGSLLKQKNYEVTFGNNISNNPDVLIIGKLKSTGDQSVQFWIDKVKLAKQNGAKIVIDYTDNYLDQHDSKFYKPFYDALISLTDRAVTSSNQLKLNLKKYFNGQIEVIEDAIEVPVFKPHDNKKDMVNILWFGHASNLKYLIKFIEQSKAFKALTNIYALTNEQGITMANQSKVDMPKNLNVHLGIWSIDAMINTAKFCDLCIIPSDLNDKRKAGVSSNRLITSLALGLPTAADKLDSYNEFDNYFIDIRSKEFEDLMEKPDYFHDQVLKAQEKIIPNFTQKTISQKWMHFFAGLN